MFPLPKLGTVLTVDDFLPYVGATYLVQTTPKTVEIRLEKLIRHPGEAWMLREPFVLIFSSPWNALLLDAHYSMQPPGGRPVEVHLIPTQSHPDERRYYHAVFN